MRTHYLSIILTIVISMFVGCGGTDKNADNPELQVNEDVIKIFSSPDLKEFLSQVYTKDRSEFAFYIDELKKQSVNTGTRNKLVEILQQPGNNDYYVATMLYLMAKANIKEAYPLVKEMMYHPDAYVKYRCVSAFSMLADRKDRDLLLPLVSKNEKFPKVRKQATEAFYALITKDDFDELFGLLTNPQGKVETDKGRKEFIMKAVKYCLDEKLDEKARKEKEGSIILLIGNTSMMAEEFLLEYFKGRLTSQAFNLLVDLYCDPAKTRKIHVITFGEIHRLMLTRKDDLNLDDVNDKFVETLITDLIEFDKHQDIIPVDVEFILEDFNISNANQEALQKFVHMFNLMKDSTVPLKSAHKILMEKGSYNPSIESIISSSKGNKDLYEKNLEALARFVDQGIKSDEILKLLNEYMISSEEEKNAGFCAKLIAKINSPKAISVLLEGLKHEKSTVTEASALGIINLSDKSYFTEIVREKELVNNILKNNKMDIHNIVSVLKVFGDMGSSAVDAKWIEQFCPYKNQKDVQNAIEAALIEIDFRERNK